MVSFKTTKEESKVIWLIVNRFDKEFGSNDILSLIMDVTACHANGCPLKLEELLNAPLLDFAHDIRGIQANIDRKTGKIKNFFVPRFAKEQEFID